MQQITIKSPTLGKVDAWARSEQPLRTCIDANNVLPRDRNDRLLLSKRWGTSKENNSSIGGFTTKDVQAMIRVKGVYSRTLTDIDRDITTGVVTATASAAHGLAVGDAITVQSSDAGVVGNFSVLAINSSTIFTYQHDTGITVTNATGTLYVAKSIFIAAINGALYYSYDRSTYTIGAGAANVLNTRAKHVALGAMMGKVYAVDGGQYVKVFDIDTLTVTNLTATAGKGSVPTYCQLLTIWRGRIVLGAQNGDHQWFMSRCLCPLDWLYGQQDGTSAMTGQNASTLVPGGISDNLLGIAPVSEDTMLFFGDHSVHVMRGDPAMAGSIDKVNDATGIMSPTAWCLSPTGNLYYVGVGGLFVFDGAAIRPVAAGQLNSYFDAINRSTQKVHLAWDTVTQGVWIFRSLVASGASSHLFWDARGGGLWPQSLPNAQGPTCVLVLDEDSGTDRVVLLGGRDGIIRRLSKLAVNDDGTAITANCVLGPVVAPRGEAFKMKVATVTLGDTPSGWSLADADNTVSIDVQGGDDPHTAYTSPTDTDTVTYSTATAQGEQDEMTLNLSYGAFVVEVRDATSGKFFHFDQIVLEGLPGGRRR
jgi:hypothetical protein